VNATLEIGALEEQYSSALLSYLVGGGEEVLERAYELGRQALGARLGVLELVAMHHRCLLYGLQEKKVTLESNCHIAAAASFLAESLSPFEMAQRGFQETYATLHHVNRSLKQGAKELKRTNSRLERAIKEHKRAEEQVRKLNEELEQRAIELSDLNKEMEAFNYSVSHDLRAPLRTLDGFSLALLEDYGDILDDKGKDFLSRIRAGSQRMAQLIDDLLTLSRLGREDMTVSEVNLSLLAKSVADDLRRSEPERNVVFQFPAEITAMGDASLLRIVLVNLIGNAWKFSSKRAVAHIEFGTYLQDGRKVYFVKDDGAGFDMRYSAKLFGAFQRLHGSTEFPGTGIGLATVQRIIHRHGGQVFATSAVNEGATFTFTLGKE